MGDTFSNISFEELMTFAKPVGGYPFSSSSSSSSSSMNIRKQAYWLLFPSNIYTNYKKT